jgi:hypothetical protein
MCRYCYEMFDENINFFICDDCLDKESVGK